jgi:predicted nucleic acid-binding protein
MNLYADTSALIKKYVREAGSEEAAANFEQHEAIVSAAITQVEMASAMAKAARLGWVDKAELSSAWRDFLGHWPAYIRLPLSAAVVERAADLIWKHGLRAYEAVHLASALTCKDMTGDELVFACYDKALSEAARQEGLEVWPGTGD